MKRRVQYLVLAAAVLAVVPIASAQTIDPGAAGTIRRLPELGIFESLGSGADRIQSSYFRTTDVNREFRRGIAEFSIPSGTILAATLVLSETRGTVSYPFPPDLHHVTGYSPADLDVTLADYDRAGVAVGSMETDANEETKTFTFDVTSLVTAAAGGTIGFRVQLDVDPAEAGFLPLGSEFAVTLGLVTPALAVGLDVTPDPLNLSSRGRWVTANLEPPPPFAAADIDVASIRMNETVAVDPGAPTQLEDHDGDGVVSLIVKFDREAVAKTLAEGQDVTVTVSGTLGGQRFTGTDHIDVIRRTSDPVPATFMTPGMAKGGPSVRGLARGRLSLGVELTLPDASPARLDLVDVAGRAVVSREVGSLGPGRHAFDLSEGRALGPGIYFLRLMHAAGEVRTRVAILRD